MHASTASSFDPYELGIDFDLDIDLDIDLGLDGLTPLSGLDASIVVPPPPPNSSMFFEQSMDNQAALAWHKELTSAQRVASLQSSDMFTAQGKNLDIMQPIAVPDNHTNHHSRQNTSTDTGTTVAATASKPNPHPEPFGINLAPHVKPDLSDANMQDVAPVDHVPEASNLRPKQELDLDPRFNAMISKLSADIDASNKMIAQAQRDIFITKTAQVPSETSASANGSATASASASGSASGIASGSESGNGSGSGSGIEKPMMAPSGSTTLFPTLMPVKKESALAPVDTVHLGHVLDDAMDTATDSKSSTPPASYQTTLPVPAAPAPYPVLASRTPVHYRSRTRGNRKKHSLYRCSVLGCERGFPLKSNLKKHRESVHLKMRPYACHLCSRTFYERCKLKGHISTVHLGQRDFPCDFPGCNKEFKQNSDRKRHLREVHQKLKRY